MAMQDFTMATQDGLYSRGQGPAEPKQPAMMMLASAVDVLRKAAGTVDSVAIQLAGSMTQTNITAAKDHDRERDECVFGSIEALARDIEAMSSNILINVSRIERRL